MKRIIIPIAVVVALVVGVRVLLEDDASASVAEVPGASSAPAVDRAPDASTLAEPRQTPDEARAVVQASPEQGESGEQPEPPAVGRQLVLRVVDPSGSPVAKASVSPTLLNSGMNGRTRLERGVTGVDGRWRVPLSASELALYDQLSLHINPREPWLAFSWGGPIPTEELELVAFLPGSLSGRVVLEPAGEPVSSGTLQVQWARSEEIGGTRTAKIEDGAFSMTGVSGRIRRVGLLRRGERYLSNEVGDLNVPAGEEVNTEFAFQPGSDLHLLFLDELTREPVAEVSASTSGLQAKKSDAEGRLTLVGSVDPGGFAVVSATHPDYAPAKQKVAGPRSAGELEVVFELQRGAELSGVVVDVAGVPQVGLSVVGAQKLMSRDGQGSSRQLFKKVAKTDDEGRFELGGLPHCEGFDVTFTRDGKTVAFYRVDLPEAAPREVWLVDDPVAVSGRVVDSSGQGLPSVAVSASGRRGQAWATATTGAGGDFRLEGVVPGPWHLSVQYGDPIPTLHGSYEVFSRTGVDLDVTPGGLSNVRIELPEDLDRDRPWVTLEIEVTDAATGSPLSRFDWIQFNGLDNSMSTATTGGELVDGRTTRLLRAGHYDLWLSHDDFGEVMQEVHLDGAEKTVRLRLALKKQR